MLSASTSGASVEGVKSVVPTVRPSIVALIINAARTEPLRLYWRVKQYEATSHYVLSPNSMVYVCRSVVAIRSVALLCAFHVQTFADDVSVVGVVAYIPDW